METKDKVWLRKLIFGGWGTIGGLTLIDKQGKSESLSPWRVVWEVAWKLGIPFVFYPKEPVLPARSQRVITPALPEDRRQVIGNPLVDFPKSFEKLLPNEKISIEDVEANVAKILALGGLKPLALPIIEDPLASRWREMVPTSSMVLIIGKRGSGKSALGYYLLETLHAQGKPYIVGLPPEAHHLLPSWCGVVSRLEDAPQGAVVLVDEAYAFYQSRESQTQRAKDLLGILGVSRKKGQTLIFVAHESRQIDINIPGYVDVLVVKYPSLFQTGLDRPVIRPIVEKARAAFDRIEGDKRRFGYVVSDPAGFRGVLESGTASFWSEELSGVFVKVEAEADRPAKEMSREQKKAEAKRFNKLGWSIRQIAAGLGVSPGTVSNYLHEDEGR